MAENCTRSEAHKDGDVFVLRVGITYSGSIGTSQISRTEWGNLRGLYGAGAYKSPFKTCAEYGGICCNSANETCSGTFQDSSDCGICCIGTCVTTTTTITTTTSTTIITTTTSTTIVGHYVCICGTCYNCGVDDNVCPNDFGVGCITVPDPNC